MLSALQTSLTALRAFGRKLGVTANNVANINTDGYQPQQAVMQEASAGGVRAQVVAPDNRPAVVPGEAPVTGAAVDLPTEMTNMILARRGYQASVKAAQTADEMDRALLDLRE